VEARRLTDMVAKRQGGSYVAMPSRSRLPGRLAEAEATLAEGERVLGPNNPNLARFRAARDAAKLQVEAERGAIASSTNIDAMIERSRQSAIEAQKERVLSQRQLALEVRLLQDEIEARSMIVKAMNARVAQLRVQATSQDVNLTPIGAATPKSGPVFPKPELILGGTGSIGLAIGVLLAILTELLNRRLRFAYQLDASAGATLIGVTPSMHRSVRPGWWWRGRRLGNAIAAQ
jgi:succinoglycan biosynthesis transport protein ExoP